MKRWLVTLALAACGSPPPSLQPVVRADAQLAATLSFVELTVLAKPTTCDAVTAAPLFMQNGLDPVATANLAPTASQTFTALARGSYVVVAEAFDASGTRVARGCIEVAVGEKREVARATVVLHAL